MKGSSTTSACTTAAVSLMVLPAPQLLLHQLLQEVAR
jgi:hypothetical protein